MFAFVGGIGGLAGAWAAPRVIAFRGRVPAPATSTGVGGATFVVMGLFRQTVADATLLSVFAGTVVVANVVLATSRHALVPDELLGRVLDAWRSMVRGMIPVGALLGGVLTRLMGSASATFAVSGALQIALAGLVAVTLRRFSLSPEPAPASQSR